MLPKRTRLEGRRLLRANFQFPRGLTPNPRKDSSGAEGVLSIP